MRNVNFTTEVKKPKIEITNCVFNILEILNLIFSKQNL